MFFSILFVPSNVSILEEHESSDSSGLNPGAVAGIVCAVLLVVVFVLGELFCCGTYPVNISTSKCNSNHLHFSSDRLWVQ